MLWVRNLSVMELGALFSKTGIFCLKSVLNLQMTYIIIAHIYEQWDR